MTEDDARRGRVVAVVLAAGRATRLGRPKQLLPLGDRPLLAQTLARVSRSSVDGIVVVLGYAAAAIRQAIDFAAFDARVVVNERYAAGQSTSLRTGLAALPPDATAALFVLGDQPLLAPAVYDAVLARYRAFGGPIVVPEYAGRRGNPVLIDRALWPELMTVTGDQGARGVVAAHASEVAAVPIAGEPITDDVDSEEDYQRLLARYREQHTMEEGGNGTPRGDLHAPRDAAAEAGPASR